MISSNPQPFPDQDSSPTGNAVPYQPISLAVKQAMPAREFTVVARRRLHPDGSIEREISVGLPAGLASAQSLWDQSLWKLFKTSGDLRTGEWLAITGFDPPAQAALNRQLRPLLREAEILGARLGSALYRCPALAEQTPEYYQTLLVLRLSAIPGCQVDSFSLELSDDGTQARLRAWRAWRDARPSRIIDGPLARRLSADPGWTDALRELAARYDGQAAALADLALGCFEADRA